jgi:hypothetical protein
MHDNSGDTIGMRAAPGRARAGVGRLCPVAGGR